MDSATACLDFAIIGHQDSWQNIAAFINGIRDGMSEKLSTEKIKDIFSFIPPRDVFKIKARSATGDEITGAYIETFIEPDKLDAQFIKTNINKVKNAISFAKKTGAKVVTMGGFTSIVVEGNLDQATQCDTKFTTGNTLTAAYIVKGIEKAAIQRGLNLQKASILIIGATGDIGIACVNYLKQKCRRLLLCARNKHRLEKLSGELTKENVHVIYSVSIGDLISSADIIICVASSSGLRLDQCKQDVLICDAGYPKNVDAAIENSTGGNIFHGGMGRISCGYKFNPDYSRDMYHYPAPYISHGCVLEAVVLAFEKRFETYSAGKGNITIEKMEEIYSLSLKHGITLAPFYNSNGLWQT